MTVSSSRGTWPCSSRPVTGRSSSCVSLGESRRNNKMISIYLFGSSCFPELSAVRRIAVPPEELYATQLATARNVHAAVERLLGNMGQYNMMMIISDHNCTLIMLSIVGIMRSCLVHWFYTGERQHLDSVFKVNKECAGGTFRIHVVRCHG